jgi:phage gp16-like protein
MDESKSGSGGSGGVTDVVLAHYGTKGMHWGVRTKSQYSETTSKSEVAMKERPGKKLRTKGGKELPASADAKKVAVSKQQARKSSTDSLSTKDLQELVNRMNLEQQYSRLDPNALKKGAEFAKKATKDKTTKSLIGGTLKVGMLVANDPRVSIGMKVAEAFLQVSSKKPGKKKK